MGERVRQDSMGADVGDRAGNDVDQLTKPAEVEIVGH
jgi:hypothetical protein